MLSRRVWDLDVEHTVEVILFVCFLAAPTGYPGNLRIVEVSNTSAVLSWEPVEKTKRNSEISGYLIQISNGQNTKSEYVNSPSTVQLQIR